MAKVKIKHLPLLKLKNILEFYKDSRVYKTLGLGIALNEKNLRRCYDEFSEIAPVQQGLGYINYLRAISGLQKESVFRLLQEPLLFVKNTPHAVAQIDDQVGFPLSKKALSASFEIEKYLFEGRISGLKKISGDLFHIYENPEDFFIPGSYVVRAGDFRAIRLNHAPYRYKRRIWPRSGVMARVGKSKYQRIHAFLDQLTKCGDRIEVIMACPQVMSDVALYLSQREGRQVPLKEICPNLKVFVHYDERIAPYRKVIEAFFHGMNVTYLKLVWSGSGLLALQTDVHKKGELELLSHMEVFYEFIPAEDLRADGSLMRYYRRYYEGSVTVGNDYLLVISNSSGLLCHNTGQIYTVVSQDPLRVRFKRSSEALNAFGESISLDVIEDIIYASNENLGAYGFHIREFMLGDDVDAEKSYWVFELSQTIDSIPDQYLQSVANQLHNEMSLQNRAYKMAVQSGQMPLPEIIFLSLGSISEVDLNSITNHIDISEDAERVKRILKFAPIQKSFKPYVV